MHTSPKKIRQAQTEQRSEALSQPDIIPLPDQKDHRKLRKRRTQRWRNDGCTLRFFFRTVLARSSLKEKKKPHQKHTHTHTLTFESQGFFV